MTETNTPPARPFFTFSLLGKQIGEYFIPYVLRTEMKCWAGSLMTVPIYGRQATYNKVVLLDYNDFVLPSTIKNPLTALYNKDKNVVEKLLKLSQLQEDKCIMNYVEHYDWVNKKGKVKEYNSKVKVGTSIDCTIRSATRHVLRSLFTLSVVLTQSEEYYKCDVNDMMLFNTLAKIQSFKILEEDKETVLTELYSKDDDGQSMVKNSLWYHLKLYALEKYIKVMRIRKKIKKFFKKKKNEESIHV